MTMLSPLQDWAATIEALIFASDRPMRERELIEHLPETIDLFSLCDVLRNELTTYLDHINKYVMKDSGAFFYGCIQN